MEESEKVVEAMQLQNLIIHLVREENDVDTLRVYLTLLTTEKRLRETA